ncbi:hypothetical protein HCJ39_06820 [Listeria rocourtiae]|uniref:inositol monophosphatase family protein n=1 Tax=Listeria rocourtiae TaxID=647910 RepID=UPI001629C89C|nr:inositol monophosphatase family protein [Listeria rocourtiae]MBC1604422.1 hypothetical protein [Listeria rocourtiae]
MIKNKLLDVLEQLRVNLNNEYKKNKFNNNGIYSVCGADGEATWNIDKEVEDLIIHHLLNLPYNFSILSEEMGFKEYNKSKIAEDIFILIDPIDGTYNALMKFPFFSTSICIFINGIPTIGWVYDISRDVLFLGIEGQGAYQVFNGVSEKIDVSDVRYVSESTISMIRPRNEIQLEIYKDIILSSNKVRWLSCSSLEIVYVASGIFEAFVDYTSEKNIKICDVAASIFILKEAGGVTLDYELLMSNIDLKSLDKRYNIISANSNILLNEVYRRMKNR